MRHYVVISFLIFLLCGVSVRGAEHTSIEESGKNPLSTETEESGNHDDSLRVKSLDRHISLSWENDLFYQHDYYFTNGFQVDFFHEAFQRSPINWILIPAWKKREGGGYSGLKLRQEVFTPKDLAADSISVGDHPYSSTLTLAQVRVIDMPDRLIRIMTGLRLGVLGPASLGFKTQELAHSVSNPSRPPQGWDYQLQNDLIINYDLQIEKGLAKNNVSVLGLKGKGRLGTLHTDLEAGLWYRFDARNGYFNRFGPSGDPGFNIVFQLSATTRYVLYDATLQGGVFNKTSPYVLPTADLNRWIGNLDFFLTFELWEHQLEIHTQWTTPRFLSAVPHGWIGITYKYWF